MNTQNEIIEVTDYKEEVKGTGIRYWIGKALNYLRTNSIRVEKDGKEIITVKLILFVVFALFLSEILVPVMLISLFFKIRYSIVGRNSSHEINRVFDSLSHGAEAIKKEFQHA